MVCYGERKSACVGGVDFGFERSLTSGRDSRSLSGLARVCVSGEFERCRFQTVECTLVLLPAVAAGQLDKT